MGRPGVGLNSRNARARGSVMHNVCRDCAWQEPCEFSLEAYDARPVHVVGICRICKKEKTVVKNEKIHRILTSPTHSGGGER